LTFKRLQSQLAVPFDLLPDDFLELRLQYRFKFGEILDSNDTSLILPGDHVEINIIANEGRSYIGGVA